ncbi:Glutamate--tRNA ligase 1 [Pseudovibrio axinellae]|uniref:Glutamate--tRNA ligase n=1 Tax=Pseudovibrio axinellae TaxID=989403 RepID=A0A165XKH6_9HYPH|nr:glutamate--tRNA ligase [Pseudovibrio axinellae]KZL17793.1 Glutamate--tRNA ligase 1 [Pseudovibrio axinellae]SEP72324.1 glutamyl-tRNA synthetase [Pseudovibrio axinellae]
MSVTVRFAPSPTGHIHIGNVRPALFNYLFARKQGGTFVLRYDDTDIQRSKDEYAQGIAEDLKWLGINPDRVEKQSARFASYDDAAAKLKEAGLLYPCYETPEELERRRNRARAMGRPPVYDRAGLKLTDEQVAEYEAEGRKPHWRFKLPNHTANDPFSCVRTDVHWDDVIRGRQTVDLASLSDPVLVRADGTYLYTLPSIVDDAEMGITHVIRGEDHIANTGVQIAIFEALGAKVPEFGHHNLLTTSSGEGLSKRSGALSIRSLREAGYEPMAVCSLAVLTGTSHAVEPAKTMEGLADMLDFTGISKSAAKFDPDDVGHLTAKLVHGMSFAEVAERLKSDGVAGDEKFWNVVKENCSTVNDAKKWWELVVGSVTPEIADEDKEFVSQAKALLPQEPWDETTWGEWTKAVKGETGRKGKGLFMPLRKAITGLAHGPDLKNMLPFIGREKTLDRLS